MRILIIDRDEVVAPLIKSKLEPLGHEVVHESSKDSGLETLASQPFHMVMTDPSPLIDMRPVVLNVRRAVSSYPYVVLMSENGDRAAALKAGANDALAKPVSTEALDKTIENTRTLLTLMKRMGDDSEDFPSAGGVIAKSAFNQLFLSGIDRADRYAERTFVLFITMSNYDEIRNLDGQYAADYAVAKLAQYLVLLRRQSDIIGQSGRDEYALLLQRPAYDTEPVEAAKRFAQSLEKCSDIVSSGSAPVEVTVSLVDLPVGSRVVEYVVMPGVEAEQGNS